jgi:hypothetical protein
MKHRCQPKLDLSRRDRRRGIKKEEAGGGSIIYLLRLNLRQDHFCFPHNEFVGRYLVDICNAITWWIDRKDKRAENMYGEKSHRQRRMKSAFVPRKELSGFTVCINFIILFIFSDHLAGLLKDYIDGLAGFIPATESSSCKKNIQSSRYMTGIERRRGDLPSTAASKVGNMPPKKQKIKPTTACSKFPGRTL